METPELKKQLLIVGQDVVAEITQQLLDADKNATGNLINSLDSQVLEVVNGLLLNILADPYLKNVDEGRRPGARMPPVKAIKAWVEARGIIFNRGGSVLTPQQTAFVIARSIGIKGIQPLGIKQKVIDNILNRKQEFLAQGLTLDIVKYINTQIFSNQQEALNTNVRT